MNKKSQFFLIAAVIVCIMIFSINRTFYSPPSVKTENYYTLYTGIKRACMDTVKYSGDLGNDLNRLKTEMEELCKEAGINLILNYEIEGSDVEFYLKLYNSETVIEDPFRIVISSMNVKIEDPLQNKIIVKGEIIKKEDFYRYEKLYEYKGEFVRPMEGGSEYRVDGYYIDTIPRIGAFSSLNLKYTPYEIIEKDLKSYDFIIVTELSGVDYEKSYALYEYLKNGGNILFVGESGRNFVDLLNESDIKVLNMTKNDFYSDGKRLVTIGKGNVLLKSGSKNIIVYGDKTYEDGKEIKTGKVFFSVVDKDYEDILEEIIFKTFKKKDEKNISLRVDKDIILEISGCKGMILQINSEKFILTSSSYSRTLPLKKGEYTIILRDKTTVYKILDVVVY